MVDCLVRFVWRVVKVVDRVNEQLDYLDSKGYLIKEVVPYKFGSGKDSVDGFYIKYVEKIESGGKEL